MRRGFLTAALLFAALSFVGPRQAVASQPCAATPNHEARLSGDATGDDSSPNKFSAAFLRRYWCVDTSTDGYDNSTLQISVEDFVSLPKSVQADGASLTGQDGVALVRRSTLVFNGRQRVPSTGVAQTLQGADTALITGRLLPTRSWKKDEDGAPVPTFTARRIVVTD